jgi:hypothetical protein
LLEVCPNRYELRKLLARSGLTPRSVHSATCCHKPDGFLKIPIEVKTTFDTDAIKECMSESKSKARRIKEELERTMFCDEIARSLCGAQTSPW